MPILNYTTEVPAIRSIGEIQGKLVAHGARAIQMTYSGQEPDGLAFIVTTPYGDMAFRLPANVEAIKGVMEKERAPGRNKPGQPARVAWRILKDWVEAQMAILEAEMVTLQQVFLPYMIVGKNKTLYEAMEDKKFYLPEGESNDKT